MDKASSGPGHLTEAPPLSLSCSSYSPPSCASVVEVAATPTGVNASPQLTEHLRDLFVLLLFLDQRNFTSPVTRVCQLVKHSTSSGIEPKSFEAAILIPKA